MTSFSVYAETYMADSPQSNKDYVSIYSFIDTKIGLKNNGLYLSVFVGCWDGDEDDIGHKWFAEMIGKEIPAPSYPGTGATTTFYVPRKDMEALRDKCVDEKNILAIANRALDFDNDKWDIYVSIPA